MGKILTVCAIALGQVLALAPSSLARLGDTEEQAKERYGEPVEPVRAAVDEDVKIATYVYKGLDITVLFLNGKSQAEDFKKQREARKFTSEDLSVNEIELLLKANSSSKEWRKVDELFSVEEKWTLGDRKEAFAFYASLSRDPTLTICTSEYLAHRESKTKSEEAKKLEGF